MPLAESPQILDSLEILDCHPAGCMQALLLLEDPAATCARSKACNAMTKEDAA